MNMNKYLEEKLLPFLYLAKDADHNLRLKGCELFAQMFEMGMIPTLEAAKSFVMMQADANPAIVGVSSH